MPQETNYEYYTRRAAVSRQLAAAASDERVGMIHLEMAARYDSLAQLDADKPPMAVVNG